MKDLFLLWVIATVSIWLFFWFVSRLGAILIVLLLIWANLLESAETKSEANK